MKHLPLISVVIPVYKVERYLDRCLASVTGQTYDHLQILLVDDGSPDGSGAICDRWAVRDSRITVLHQENAGGGAARNAALDRAEGELLAFVDSDDYLHPEMFSHLYDLLERTGADIAECAYVETESEDAPLGGGALGHTCYTRQEAMMLHIRDTHFRQLIWNKLYRRQVAEGVRFPVGTKIDDEFFTYRLLGNARTLVRSERVCYAYRQQAGSVMHQGFSLKRVESLSAKQQRLSWIQDNLPQLENEAKQELLMACLLFMQESFQDLRGPEQKQARKRIHEVVRDAKPLTLSRELPRLRRYLLTMAQWNLEATARLLQFLTAIHVLT